MAESTLPQPPARGFRIRPMFVIIALVVLALGIIVTVDVIGILEGRNQESIIYRTADGILKFVFEPSTRVAPENIVVCQREAACSTTHAFLYSAILLLTVITGFAYTTLLERRFIAFFQSRIGPNRVGPLGLMQPAADAVKLIMKEDITPAGASWFVWYISPMIKAVPTLVVLAIIPLGPDILLPWFDGKWYQVPLSLADPNVGILWLLAILSIGTYGLVLAGWSSNNKYAMLGGLRASAQMISYELSLGLTMAVPVMIVGSMSLGDITKAQPMLWNWFVFQNPLAAGVLFVALLAEVSRAPFDLPEAEQELTAGFMTEYSGMKFALFMMAEYLGMIAISLIVALLYFGGYQDGFGLVNRVPILGPLVIIGKVVLLLIFMIWIRATLPRIRYDRLMHFGWKVMLPLALISVSWTAISLVVGDTFKSNIAYAIAGGIFFVVIVAGGYLFMRRSGTEATPVEDDLSYDPIITGERSGIGFAILNIIGTLIAIPMGLLSFTVDQLEKVAEWGGEESKETALTVAPTPQVQVAPIVRQEAPVQAAPAAASAPKAAPTAEAAPKAGGKAKFDKEAMLAKIREKKAQKGS